MIGWKIFCRRSLWDKLAMKRSSRLQNKTGLWEEFFGFQFLFACLESASFFLSYFSYFFRCCKTSFAQQYLHIRKHFLAEGNIQGLQFGVLLGAMNYPLLLILRQQFLLGSIQYGTIYIYLGRKNISQAINNLWLDLIPVFLFN